MCLFVRGSEGRGRGEEGGREVKGRREERHVRDIPEGEGKLMRWKEKEEEEEEEEKEED